VLHRDEKAAGLSATRRPYIFIILQSGAKGMASPASRMAKARAPGVSEQMRSANGGRRGLFEVSFKRSLEGNEFRSRADATLTAVEP